jgi:hypothetical protein
VEKKHKILIIGVIVFIVMVYFFYNPSKIGTNITEKKEDVNQIETTKVTDNVNLIDYLNLEAENRELRKEINSLKSDIFELHKIIINSDSNNISHYYNIEDILYKEVTDNKIIILREGNDSFINSYMLSIATKKDGMYSYISDLEDGEVINYSGADGFYSGLIDENVINDVIVEVNDKSHIAEIVNFADNISFWYTMFEHKRKSTSENPDKIRIKAVNELGVVVWEESFEGSLGG